MSVSGPGADRQTFLNIIYKILGEFAFNYISRSLCLIAFTLLMGITRGVLPVLTNFILFLIVGALNVCIN
jgi:hypothetical protein